MYGIVSEGFKFLFLSQLEGPGSSLRTTHDDQDMAFPAEVESAAGAKTEKLIPTVEILGRPEDLLEAELCDIDLEDYHQEGIE